jgi:hypothetical protein
MENTAIGPIDVLFGTALKPWPFPARLLDYPSMPPAARPVPRYSPPPPDAPAALF